MKYVQRSSMMKDNSVQIGGSVGGSVTAGDVRGNVSSHVGGNVSGSETYSTDFSRANVANFANKVQDEARQQAKQNIYTAERKRTLAEAANEIQKLLKQLEQSNPTVIEAEKIAYVNDETTTSFKRRVASALEAGGEAAIEEFLDNPYINIGKAIVKGWLKPD
jgi:hypothetical protein